MSIHVYKVTHTHTHTHTHTLTVGNSAVIFSSLNSTFTSTNLTAGSSGQSGFGGGASENSGDCFGSAEDGTVPVL